jgi:transcriptional regulator with XRE-family HTH domain
MRREKGLSQQELADLAGVGQDSVSAIETGKHEPHPRTLRKLAAVLDAEVVDFFREQALSGKADASATGPPEEDPLKYLRVVRAFIWKTHERWKEDRPQTGREVTTVLEALDALLGEGVFDLKEGSVNPSEWFELALIRDGARKLASIAEEIEGEGSPRQRRTLHLVQEKTSA